MGERADIPPVGARHEMRKEAISRLVKHEEDVFAMLAPPFFEGVEWVLPCHAGPGHCVTEPIRTEKFG